MILVMLLMVFALFGCTGFQLRCWMHSGDLGDLGLFIVIASVSVAGAVELVYGTFS